MSGGVVLFLSLLAACIIALVLNCVNNYQLHKHNSRMTMKPKNKEKFEEV